MDSFTPPGTRDLVGHVYECPQGHRVTYLWRWRSHRSCRRCGELLGYGGQTGQREAAMRRALLSREEGRNATLARIVARAREALGRKED